MNMEKIRVLQILIGGENYSGVSSYLYQQYKHIDRDRVLYDFLFCRKDSMSLVENDEIFKDSDFVALNAVKEKTLSTDYIMLFRGVKQTLGRKTYDYMVINTSVVEVIFTCMLAAKAFTNVRIIAHAHNAEIITKSKSIRNRLSMIVSPAEAAIKKIIRDNSYSLFACSERAGEVTFGKKAVNLEKFSVIRNGIELKRFEFNEKERALIRAESATPSDVIVYGNIGTLCKRKNQFFLLDVFTEILIEDPNAELWLVGDGEYKDMLLQRADELGIKEKVVFWGQRKDVSRLLNGMDCFIFPTLSEGLGIVAIEAQASGLPTIVSDGVPEEVVLTQSCKRIPLDKDAKMWAEEITAFRRKFSKRNHQITELEDAGYDIYSSAEKMSRFLVDNSR